MIKQVFRHGNILMIINIVSLSVQFTLLCGLNTI